MPTHRSMGWKLGMMDWNAVLMPVIMFSSFPERSAPGASRAASLTLVISSAMNTYGMFGRMSFL